VQLRSEIDPPFIHTAYRLKKFQTDVRTSKRREKVPFTLRDDDEWPPIEAEIEKRFHQAKGKNEMVLFAIAHFELVVEPPPPSQPALEQVTTANTGRRTGPPRRTATTVQEELAPAWQAIAEAGGAYTTALLNRWFCNWNGCFHFHAGICWLNSQGRHFHLIKRQEAEWSRAIGAGDATTDVLPEFILAQFNGEHSRLALESSRAYMIRSGQIPPEPASKQVQQQPTVHIHNYLNGAASGQHIQRRDDYIALSSPPESIDEDSIVQAFWDWKMSKHPTRRHLIEREAMKFEVEIYTLRQIKHYKSKYRDSANPNPFGIKDGILDTLEKDISDFAAEWRSKIRQNAGSIVVKVVRMGWQLLHLSMRLICQNYSICLCDQRCRFFSSFR